MKKFVGNVSVDSGQVLLVDPCYLKDYKDNDFVYRRGVQKDGKIYTHPRWDAPIKAEGGKTMNDLRAEGWEEFSHYPDAGEFSYSGICGVTCKDNVGECAASGIATCVASSSGFGDGNYPVYATFKDGRVKKLEIVFF